MSGPGYTNIYNINTRYENIWQIWAVDPILAIAMIVLNNHTIINTEDKYKIEDFERTSWRLFHKRFMRAKLDLYYFVIKRYFILWNGKHSEKSGDIFIIIIFSLFKKMHFKLNTWFMQNIGLYLRWSVTWKYLSLFYWEKYMNFYIIQ